MDNEPRSKVTYLREYGFAFSATISLFAGGASAAWVTTSLPLLMDESQERPITSDEGSWIVSLFILASAISPWPAAFMVEKLGRKMTLLLGSIPIIASWLIIILDNSIAWLYVSRLLSGWNFGFIYTVLPIYLGEISSKNVRGSIGILITIMAKLGALTVYCIGPYVTILEHAAIQILVPMAFILVFMWSPETPYYLLMRQKEDKAEHSLRRLRGLEEVSEELNSISEAVELDEAHPRSFRELFQTKGNRRGVVVIIALFCGSELCGNQAVLAYAQQIFTKADVLDPKLSTILFGIVALAAAVFSSMVVDKCGRRPLLILSTTGVTVMTAAIGLYFFFKDFLQWHMKDLNWLPIVLMLVYIALYNIGLSSVSYMMIGELFPTNVKAVASCSTITLIGLLSFAVTKLYQIIADGWGIYMAFWIFCLCSMVSLVFIIIYVPETKGKSLAQIQIVLNKKSSKSNNSKIT